MITTEKTYFFMAGLPRAGSTLLATILNQNPLIYASTNSPVTNIMLTIINHIAESEHYVSFPKPNSAENLISRVIENWYYDKTTPIIVDKNRGWTHYLKVISRYITPEPKILCPVRNIDEIVASFINLVRKNRINDNEKLNFIDEQLVKSNTPINDMNRFKLLVSGNGVVGESYNGIKNLVEQGQTKNLHFIEYNDLVNDPQTTMNKIYDFLELDHYTHDFKNLKNVNIELDLEVHGLAGMHDVRPVVKKTSPKPEEILSPEILQNCLNAEFWRNL